MPLYRAAGFGLAFEPAAAGAGTVSWTGADQVRFAERVCASWPVAGGSVSVLGTGSRRGLRFSAVDAVHGAKYEWSVSEISFGTLWTSRIWPGGIEQPALTLRVDQSRGELLGSYMGTDGVLRRCYGVVVPAEEGSFVVAQGWMEAGTLPGIRTGEWELSR